MCFVTPAHLADTVDCFLISPEGSDAAPGVQQQRCACNPPAEAAGQTLTPGFAAAWLGGMLVFL